jgi:hypothetical protein
VSDRYQIATSMVAVQVSFESGAPLLGRMFLLPRIAGHAGRETVIDRLNDGVAFFPLQVDEPRNGVVLVSKARVRFVVAPSSADDERVAAYRAAATQIGVIALFDEALSVSGVLFIDLPSQAARTLDYLNDQGRTHERLFVTLAQPGRDVFVNRSLVRYFRDST